MGPMWLSYYFCPFNTCIHTGWFNIHGTYVTVLLFLPIQYLYAYRVSQYTWDPCDSPNISAHSIFVCIQGVSIFMGSMWLPNISAHSLFVYVQGVSIFMGSIWLPYYFCPFNICIRTGCLNKHGTNVTVLLFLPIQYFYTYRVSQYTWDPFDCPIISAHSILLYTQGDSIYMGPMWLSYYFCPFNTSIHTGCLNGTYVTVLLFLPIQYLYTYRVSQYTWDLCDCPIISAHSILLYIQGVSIYMGPMWLSYYFCPFNTFIHTVCLNIHGTYVTVLLFLPIQYFYTYRVSQYTWDLCDCPIISAHSILLYIQGVSIYMGPMWLSYYFCPFNICIHTGCLNIYGTHVTVLLFLPFQYVYIQGVSIYMGPMWLSYYFCPFNTSIHTGCLNIHGTYVTVLLFLPIQYFYAYKVSQYTWDLCDCPIISAHSIFLYIQGVSICMGPMWLSYYFCPFNTFIHTGCLNIHGTYVTVLLFLPIQYLIQYTYTVLLFLVWLSYLNIHGTYVTVLLFLHSILLHIQGIQYTWDHSILVYIQGVSIYMGPMWLSYYFCPFNTFIHTVCLNIHGTYVTVLLFLPAHSILLYIQGVSIYMGPMWLSYYFCPFNICIHTGCLNIYGTHVTVLLFLPIQYFYTYRVFQYTWDLCDCPIISAHSIFVYIQGVSIYMGPMWLSYYFCPFNMYTYRVSQYTWDPCDCPIISAHSILLYIQGVSIYMGPMWLSYYFCPFNTSMHTRCLNIHGTYVTVLLFLPIQYFYTYRVSQYTWDLCDCPIISAHSILLYIQCVSIYMGPMWLSYYFCPFNTSIHTGCLNIHGTYVTVLLFLPIQYLYTYRVSQYIWDPCDCPIISAHSILLYIQGVSIYMGPMWLSYYFCPFNICIHTGCVNIYGTHVTVLLFLPFQYVYIQGVSIYMGPMWLSYYFCPFNTSIHTGCLNIHGTYVTVLLFLPIQYFYAYKVSQYTWDLCDCPIISAHSIFLYIQGVSICMGPMWLSYYFCPFNTFIHTGCLNIHGTYVTVLLFLPIQYLYTYRVIQYTWDLCDCPIISAHSILVYIQGISIYMGPMWLSYYFCPFNISIHTGCLNIHGTYVTVLLFLPIQYFYTYRVSQYTWDQCDCPIISAYSIFLYIQGVSIYMGPMWMSYYFCPFNTFTHTGWFNIHGTYVTVLLFLPIQYFYTYRVSQYTWDLCDCPIISAYSIFLYIQGVSIYMGPMWMSYYFCPFNTFTHTGCLNIHGTYVTVLLFLPIQYFYTYRVFQYTWDLCDCPIISAHSIFVYIQGVSIYMGPMWLSYYFCPFNMYTYRVSQYTWDPCDCPIISAHSILLYIQGVSIYMGPMWLSYYFCPFNTSMHTRCLNIHGTYVTVLLFLPIQYFYTYRVSQYAWDLCDCPIISAHSILLYILGVSIYMGPMWLSYYFCPFNTCIHTGWFNIHGTYVTVLLFLPIQYLYTYRVSQYTWDLCDCPIISAHSIFLYIQGVSIYMGPMWLSYYFCPFNTFIHTGCLNIHGTNVTVLLFLPIQYFYTYRVSQYTWDLCECPIISAHSILLHIQGDSIYMGPMWLSYYFCPFNTFIHTGCLNIHGTYVTVLLFLPIQYFYTYRVSQYTWDLCECPIISAHSILLHIQGDSIYMGPMWLSYYFCPFNISIHTGCLNIHGTYVNVLLFLPIQYFYTYRVSQYTWDPCDCPIISAHSIFVYIQCVTIYMGPMWLSYYFCPFNISIHTGCLNMHGTYVTVLLFLPIQYFYTYRVSQYTWDLCDCPIISAHSILLYIQGVSIYMGPMWLSYYFCPFNTFIHTGCLNIHGTYVTVLLFLPIQYFYTYRVSQYTWDLCDCPIISAHSILLYIQGVSIYMGPMWLSYYFCPFNTFIHTGCLNIHGTYVNVLLFLPIQYFYTYSVSQYTWDLCDCPIISAHSILLYIQGVSIYMGPMWLSYYFCPFNTFIHTGCLNIHGTYVTVLLFLPIQYFYTYSVSQYTWDLCDCPIISALSILLYIQGVSIYMGPMWLLITLLIIMLCSFCFRFENSIQL